MWDRINTKKLTSKSDKRRLNVYQSEFVPAWSMYRFDDKLVKVDPQLWSDHKTKALNTIMCENNYYDRSFYTNYMRDFELVVSNGKKIQ